MEATMGQAESGGERPEESFLERIARALGTNAGAQMIFGEPVERSGITVIPVARAKWGFGGGSGTGQTNAQEGSGGGGGVSISPLGYIEVKDGESSFRPVYDPMGTTLIVAAGMVVILLLRSVRKLFK